MNEIMYFIDNGINVFKQEIFYLIAKRFNGTELVGQVESAKTLVHGSKEAASRLVDLEHENPALFNRMFIRCRTSSPSRKVASRSQANMAE